MIILGIETTSRIGSLGLVSDEEILGEKIISTDSHHSANMVSAFKHLMTDTHCDINDLNGIGVSIGPGSFTGIRIGISMAMGLSASCDIPLVGIGTMESVLYDFQNKNIEICVVLEAGRGNIYAGLYEFVNNVFTPAKEQICCKPERFEDYIDKSVTIIGPGTTLVKENLSPSKQVIIDDKKQHLNSLNIASMACEKIKSGQRIEDVKPLYVRASYVGKTQ